jgi:hypothetical protein
MNISCTANIETEPWESPGVIRDEYPLEDPYIAEASTLGVLFLPSAEFRLVIDFLLEQSP